MTFYEEMSATAAELIAEFGQTITLERSAPGAYDASTGIVPVTTTSLSGTGIDLDYTVREIDGTLVQRGDRKLLMSVKAGVVPAVSDVAIVGAVRFRVLAVKPLAPGGVTLTYELQCRQ